MRKTTKIVLLILIFTVLFRLWTMQLLVKSNPAGVTNEMPIYGKAPQFSPIPGLSKQVISFSKDGYTAWSYKDSKWVPLFSNKNETPSH